MSQSISNALQQSPKKRTVVILIDYPRAHDKVLRDALWTDISKKIIPSHMVRWIQVWLSNQLTRVSFDGVGSRTVTLKQSVQQRSVLSPILFLLYIDDLASADRAPQVSLFTDDVAVWTQYTDLERAISKLQRMLDAVASWSTSWKMKLSPQESKCSFLTTHEERWRPALCLSRQQIMYNPNTKFLGMTYDQQLTLGLHVFIVGSKMKQQAGALWCLA